MKMKTEWPEKLTLLTYNTHGKGSLWFTDNELGMLLNIILG